MYGNMIRIDCCSIQFCALTRDTQRQMDRALARVPKKA